jgi:amino acid adenylation domain-containing protein
MSKTSPAPNPPTPRKEWIAGELKLLIKRLTGVQVDQIDTHATFLQLGADSLSVLRTSQVIEEKFGVRIPFRQLIEEFSTIAALTTRIDEIMPVEKEDQEPAAVLPLSDVSPTKDETRSARPASDHPAGAKSVAAGSQNVVERIIAQQLQVMAQQLELVRNGRRQPPVTSEQSIPKAVVNQSSQATITDTSSSTTSERDEPLILEDNHGATISPEPFVPYQPVGRGIVTSLTPRQEVHIDNLIQRITARTEGSKKITAAARGHWADNRLSAGFRLRWKEMIYQIVVQRAKGARIWDVDGNEYVDITMGFGALLFGHSPDFIMEAVRQQLDQGIQLGPQSQLPGEVARLVCDLTGNERVAFCNSGTEAVMSALRLARAITGRTKVALFAGSYHGTFDGVLVSGREQPDGTLKAVPMAPGIPAHMVQDVLLWRYNDPKSIELLRAHANELAAVLIELPRSRRPDVQPREFLEAIRRLTKEFGIALIFDEVITGFRIHPGGAQGYFGVQADIVTYGKALGGGMPIGAVAGKAAYLDAIDGGHWNYGDNSYPRSETTLFAGTYFKHPLVMAAARAVLLHLRREGPALQEQLKERTSWMRDTLNAYFEERRVPVRMASFGSSFMFIFSREVPFKDLFFYHLLEKGVYVWEGRACYLSTAHTDEDVAHIVRAVKETIVEMQEETFLPAFAPSDGKQESEPRTVPLTEAQKELWFLSQLGESASVAYNQSLTLRMQGPLNSGAMRNALQSLVDRHEALRSTIGDGGEYLRISPALHIDIPLVDFSQQNGNAESHVARWLTEEAAQAFDLQRGPLLRARLVKLGAEHHLLVLTTHHIVTDGWSVGVMLKDLRELYAAECQGVQPKLAPPRQFSTYAERQVEELNDTERLASNQSYWLEELKGLLKPLVLPADNPRPPVQTFHGGSETATIDASQYHELEEFAAQHNCTLFMLLLAAFQALLWRLTQEKDVIVGVPSAGQAIAGGNVVGYCVNLLPLRTQISDDSFLQHLLSVKRTLLNAYDHQNYPFSRIIRDLNWRNDPSQPPLVSVLFNLDKGSPKAKLFGLEVEFAVNQTNSAQFEMDLNITDTGAELLLDCNYNTDLFRAHTIRRWLSSLQTLLHGVVRDPQQRVSELELMSEVERQQVLVDWNETAAEYPQASYAELFAQQVERTPEAVAVNDGAERLTYAELTERAEQLAQRLAAQGVGPETVVGLMLSRGCGQVAAMLGTFKAGGAYVPLEPQQPVGRLREMVAGSGAKAVVVSKEWEAVLTEVLAGLAAESRPAVVVLGKTTEKLEPPRVSVSTRQLAYVIYTSGSTGVPKGAMVEQGGMVNHLYAKVRELGLNETSVLAQTAAASFDISVWQYLAALLVGGRVEVFDEDEVRDPARLLRGVRERGVTVLETVPSLLRLLVESTEETGALQWLVATGEALSGELCAAWLARHKGVRVMNAYGPTECSDDVTHQVVQSAEEVEGEAWVPIGRGLQNTELYVVDEAWRAVGIGVKGELWVGGDGVGRGYVGASTQTAERFVPDSYSGRIGARLYRTGDVVRWRESGVLEYLGRLDEQVKVRGYRIELGEVEAALRRHEGVRDSVVLAREDVPGEKRLTAYLVMDHEMPGERRNGDNGHNNGAAPDTEQELRHHLRQQLPDYMIPSAFVLLATLPLTANGKIDRRALPAPTQESRAEQYIRPETSVQEVISGIWEELLGVERIGIHDNFFELGGHSLLVAQMLARLQDAFQVKLPLRRVFEDLTISVVAQLLIEISGDRARVERTADLLVRVSQLSDDEIEIMLAAGDQ